MNLHIFNPEHDIALAYNRGHLTMPHAAQELRMNLGWPPVLWASDGDAVLVDDVCYALKASHRYRRNKDVLMVGWSDLKSLPVDVILPWGWDLTLRTSLSEAGVFPGILPSEDVLHGIRLLSSRFETIEALNVLRDGIVNLTCGESRFLTSISQVYDVLAEWGDVVVKAPWSSSGRGIRYVSRRMNESTTGWVRRILEVQGGIMAEPYYNKVKDFGMEFYAHGDGHVEYEGLSLFQTENNAYTGNILASEGEKIQIMKMFLPLSLLDTIKERVCEYFPTRMRHLYAGPFGIDMMVVGRSDHKGFLLHPCVEINVRRTMGHVALSLTPPANQPVQLMRIVHDVNYTLKVSRMNAIE